MFDGVRPQRCKEDRPLPQPEAALAHYQKFGDNTVNVHSPKVLEMLEQQRQFHREQLRLIDLAITAIRADRKNRETSSARSSGTVKKHRIQWTREISRLLEGYSDFSILDLRNDLVEKRGITSARTIQGQNVINNTLNRLQKKGRIQRIGLGRYRVIQTPQSS